MGKIGETSTGRPLKIALTCDFVFTYAGAERVLYALHTLYPDAPIYTTVLDPEIAAKHFPNATFVTSFLQRTPLRRKPQLMLPLIPYAIESFDFNGYDIVLSTSGAFMHGIITGPDTVHACYCHSPMRYAWDWHAEYLREKGIRGGFKLWLAETVISRLRIWDRVSALRVDHWAANSGVVAERIKKFYRTESRVIHPPVDTDFFDPAKAHPTPGKYAITVSRLTPNKRIDLAIQACAKIGLPLQIGGEGADKERLERITREAGADVLFLGNLSEDAKRDAIAGSTCFIFAAEDDFGIAPVEALALGVPVVAFGKGGATETVEEGETGTFFYEPTPDSLAEALSRLLDEGVRKNPQAIRERALRFSPSEFSRKITQFVHDATRH